MEASNLCSVGLQATDERHRCSGMRPTFQVFHAGSVTMHMKHVTTDCVS